MVLRTTGITAILVSVAILVGCPGAGTVPGTCLHGDPIPSDSPDILRWVADLGPGGYAPGVEATTYTDPSVLGAAGSNALDVVVLGRGGSITLDLGGFITDGGGAEFVVWENGFLLGDTLSTDLGYVEVSSDGVVFVRFPVHSGNPTPVSAWGTIDPALYSGFAGLYPAGTGTAFDLAELAEEPEVRSGALHLSAVRYIRIVDVVGDGTEYDDSFPPNPIYDPYPTTGTAGFDLNAVAVLR